MMRHCIENFLFAIHFFMNNSSLSFLFFGIMGFFSIAKTNHFSLLQTMPGMTHPTINDAQWFGIIELPFLLVSVFFAFATAHKFRKSRLGIGMRYLAWSFVVMAVGHLHMQVEQFTGINIFKSLLGANAGLFIWSVALLTTWGLSAAGLYSIYKVGREEAN
jgi:hypothetical protein